jgi:hypothetical protein
MLRPNTCNAHAVCAVKPWLPSSFAHEHALAAERAAARRVGRKRTPRPDSLLGYLFVCWDGTLRSRETATGAHRSWSRPRPDQATMGHRVCYWRTGNQARLTGSRKRLRERASARKSRKVKIPENARADVEQFARQPGPPPSHSRSRPPPSRAVKPGGGACLPPL